MSMCRVFSCVVGRGCLLWPMRSLGKTLLAFALLHFVLQGQTACYSSYLLTSSFCIPVPCNVKDIIFGVSSGRFCRSSLNYFSFFEIYGWGIDLDYSDIEQFALKMNRDHSIIFESAFNYWISDSFVDPHSYSISSKGFLPTVVDIMVIWVKFTHSSPF